VSLLSNYALCFLQTRIAGLRMINRIELILRPQEAERFQDRAVRAPSVLRREA
jgi:hypothetical protein